MGVKDRERINDELHGVSESRRRANREVEWSEEELALHLNCFQIELDEKVRPEDKQTYLEAVELDGSYITRLDFRLRFLRAERFDVEKAVLRYCKCLDFLVEFFGKEALFRPLLMSDLTKSEMKFLREGYVQVLPSRDRLGRRILAMLGSYGGTRYSEVEKFRVCTYLCFTVLAEDVTTQRLGVVSLASFTRGVEAFMRKEAHECTRLIKRFFAAVPLRWSAAHLCIPDDPMFHFVKATLLFILGMNGRRMLRIHTGTPIECDYKLRSFGIPTEDIPRTHTHTIKTRNHARLIKVRKVIDTLVQKAKSKNYHSDAFYAGIECPEINCIIFGKHAWDHPGNIEFREILREIIITQDQDRKKSDNRIPIIKNVIEESQSRRFRFLMYDRETFFYEEITDYNKIWSLIEQAVREHRKRSRAKRDIGEIKPIIGGYVDENNNAEAEVMCTNNSKFMKNFDGCRSCVGE